MPERMRHYREEPLITLPSGSRGTISNLSLDDETRRELHSLGFFEGTEVRVVRRAPMGGPVLVAVGLSQYALGREIASRIRVAVG